MANKKAEYILGAQILLPKNIVKAVKSLQKRHNLGYRGNYVVYPHITLYLARYSIKGFDELHNFLTSRHLVSFEVTIRGLGSEFNKEHGEVFYYVDLKKSKNLYDLHKKFLGAANKFRYGLIREKDRARVKSGKISGLKKVYVKKYGYARVLRFFRPHITLGEMDLEKKSAAAVKNLSKKLSSESRFLRGEAIPVDHIQIGLYRFNEKKNKYTPVKECYVRLAE